MSKAEPSIRTGLGWFVHTVPGVGTMLSKTGGTLGFNSFIGFFPATRTGVMVLIHHSLADATALGRELLCMITPGCETD